MKNNVAPELIEHALSTWDMAYKYDVNNVIDTDDFK